MQIQLTPANAPKILSALSHKELVEVANSVGIYPDPPDKFTHNEIKTAIMLNVIIHD